MSCFFPWLRPTGTGCVAPAAAAGCRTGALSHKAASARSAAVAALFFTLGSGLGVVGLGVGPAAAQEAAQAVPCDDAGAGPAVRVHVVGLHNGKGEVAITLYGDQADHFLAPGGSLVRARVPLGGATTMDVCFKVSRPGLYAAAVYHDENGDHHFNRSLLGLPEEGYGFSNNAAAPMRAPSLKEAGFQVGAGLTRQDVTVRY